MPKNFRKELIRTTTFHALLVLLMTMLTFAPASLARTILFFETLDLDGALFLLHR